VKGTPAGWEHAPLGEVCRVVSGSTPKTGVAQYWGGSITWVTPNDLSRDRAQVIHGGERSLSKAGYESCSASLFPAGSVIVSSRAPIGYVAIAGEDMCTNQGCKTAVPPDFIDSRYLYWFLVNAKPDLEARASGTTFKEISGKRFAETEFWWPPVADQRRIVQTLEDHLSRLDAASASMDHALVRWEALWQSAVEGHLTGRDFPGARDDSTRLPEQGVDDGVLPRLPSGWQWARLGDLADVVGGVTKDAKKQGDSSFVEVPYLRVANVQRGFLDLRSVTTISVPPATARSLRLLPGDVLLNEGGDRDKLGRGWVWQGQVDDCIHQNHVFRARVRDDAIDPYLLSLAANSIGGRWCERNGRQSVNLASISLSKIRLMPIPVPPRGDQRVIVNRLQTLLEGGVRLRQSVQSALVETQSLRRALMTAAFTGRLTGQGTFKEVVQELASV